MSASPPLRQDCSRPSLCCGEAGGERLQQLGDQAVAVAARRACGSSTKRACTSLHRLQEAPRPAPGRAAGGRGPAPAWRRPAAPAARPGGARRGRPRREPSLLAPCATSGMGPSTHPYPADRRVSPPGQVTPAAATRRRRSAPAAAPGRRRAGMPRLTPGVTGVRPASQASPARVRRCDGSGAVGDEVVRPGPGHDGLDDVAGAHAGRRREVHEPVVAGASRRAARRCPCGPRPR